LDKNCYETIKTDINETIEILYSEIFPKLKMFKNFEFNNSVSCKKTKNTKSSNLSRHTSDVNTSSMNADSSVKLESGQLEDGEHHSAQNGENANYTDDDENENELNKSLTDREIIHMLIDWSTTSKRTGLHRIFYAVFLIKKRQIEYLSQFRKAKESIKNVRIFLL
jgi:hypothetical protein